MVSVSVSAVLFSVCVCVCVCDLLIFLPVVFVFLCVLFVLFITYNSHHKSWAHGGRITPAPQAPACGQKTKCCIFFAGSLL